MWQVCSPANGSGEGKVEGCRVQKAVGKPARHKINSKDGEEVLETQSPVSKLILLDRKQKEKKIKRKTGQKGKGGGGGDRESPTTFWSNILRLQGYQAHSL